MQFINYNGKIIPSDSPIIKANNRALKYGDGLFETLRVINGHIPFATRHFKRLKAGLKVLQFKLPKGFNNSFFKREILSLAGNNQSRVRFTVFRADGGLYLPERNQINFLIECNALESDTLRWNKKGLKIGLSKNTTLPCNQLSQIKTLNALPYVMAALERKQLKVDDIILLNQHSRIAEANNSNIFLWTGRTLITPALTEGCIAGIIRSVILDKAKQINIKVKEKKLSLQDLRKAKSIFLTNSIQGIRWVNRFENSKFEPTIGESLSNLLNELSKQ